MDCVNVLKVLARNLSAVSGHRLKAILTTLLGCGWEGFFVDEKKAWGQFGGG